MLLQQPLHHPSTYQTTLQYIEQRNVNNNCNAVADDDGVKMHYKIQPQYFLSADEITSWRRKIHTLTNPVKSYFNRERISEINRKPHFHVSGG